VWDGRTARTAASCAREALAPGRPMPGPAVIADDGATLWVAPGWSATLHRSGAVVVTRRARP